MKNMKLFGMATVIFIVSICLASAGDVTQSASNKAGGAGSGVFVSQDINQNAKSTSGGNIWQDADNVAGSSLNQVGRLNCNFPSLRYIISMRFFVVLKPLALLFAD